MSRPANWEVLAIEVSVYACLHVRNIFKSAIHPMAPATVLLSAVPTNTQSGPWNKTHVTPSMYRGLASPSHPRGCRSNNGEVEKNISTLVSRDRSRLQSRMPFDYCELGYLH